MKSERIAPATSPDTFMRAVNCFHVRRAAVERMEVGWDETAITEASDELESAAEAVLRMSPRSAAHLKAKATVLEELLQLYGAPSIDGEAFDEQADLHERFAMAFVRDVLAMASAAA